MMNNWIECKNILCIRADNMGDLIMSTPAIAALKATFNCKITILTSTSAAAVVPLITDIDDVIIADLPWVKPETDGGPNMIHELINKIKLYGFDGCIVFSVYSQNPLPAVMLAYLAGIPLRLAYCRENPYYLLTDWIQDAEPYFYIRHQVERDLDLVEKIGAQTAGQQLRLKLNPKSWVSAKRKLRKIKFPVDQPYLLLHPGVSEEKRKYPEDLWIVMGKKLLKEFGLPLLITGSAEQKELCDHIASGIGNNVFSVAGLINLEEFIAVIKHARLIITVNTSTVHIASALGQPMVVLYAQSNPQHTPWRVHHRLLEYSISLDLQSKNQVIQYVNEQYYTKYFAPPLAISVIEAVKDLLKPKK